MVGVECTELSPIVSFLTVRDWWVIRLSDFNLLTSWMTYVYSNQLKHKATLLFVTYISAFLSAAVESIMIVIRYLKRWNELFFFFIRFPLSLVLSHQSFFKRVYNVVLIDCWVIISNCLFCIIILLVYTDIRKTPLRCSCVKPTQLSLAGFTNIGFLNIHVWLLQVKLPFLYYKCLTGMT